VSEKQLFVVLHIQRFVNLEVYKSFRCEAYAVKLQPMIVDGVHYINNALSNGKRILAEGANAAMLDLDFGTYPYVTSSTTTAGGVATGLGMYVADSCDKHALVGVPAAILVVCPDQRSQQTGLHHGRCEGIHDSCWWRSVPH
jgi:adenylosuccinate synthase